MSESSNPRGIDYHIHRHMLQFERKWVRRGGLAQIILGTAAGVVGVAAIALFFFTFQFPPPRAGGLWLILGQLVLITVGFPLSLIPAGVKTLRKAEQPVADAEVEARRQAERSQLFEQAQGNLPAEFTPRGHRQALLLGGGMAVFFAIVLVTFWRQPFPLSLFGYIFGTGGIVTGLLVMVQPLAYNRRAANVLQQHSAGVLQQRLALEEHGGLDDETAAGSE